MIKIPDFDSVKPLPKGMYTGTYVGTEAGEYEKDGVVKYFYTTTFNLQPQQNVPAVRRLETKFFESRQLMDFCIKAGMKIVDGAIDDDPAKQRPFKLDVILGKDGVTNYIKSATRNQ